MPYKYQWLWNSNPDPFKLNTKEEWTTYSDIEMNIIEDAHQQKLPFVELDKYIIDLKNLLQINKMDKTKQRPIQRLSDVNLKCTRKERFTLPDQSSFNSLPRSFQNEGQFMSPKFIEEWNKRNPENELIDQIKKAAKGILAEGHKLEKVAESKWLANKLLDVKEKSWEEIAECCIFLYTKDSFFYKILNDALRKEDLSKIDTLGAFCDLLWNSLSSESLKWKYPYKGTVYRGANLTPEEIKAYEQSIRQPPKQWLGFSSTSKNQNVAEMFSNNSLIIINVPSQSQHLDISSISQFPEEQEVLLGASTSFQTEKVIFDQASGKHHIYLRILW